MSATMKPTRRIVTVDDEAENPSPSPMGRRWGMHPHRSGSAELPHWAHLGQRRHRRIRIGAFRDTVLQPHAIEPPRVVR